MYKLIIAITLLLCTVLPAFANGSNSNSTKSVTNTKQQNTDRNPWGIAVYGAKMTDNTLGEVLVFDMQMRQATLGAIEISYALSPQNIISRIFNKIDINVSLVANGTYQNDPHGNIYEFNPFIRLDWTKFPWNKYLLTTFGFGEGVSFASGIPDREIRTANHAEFSKKLLNYLMFELDFALPSHPNLQMFYRVHHRSGCYGLYQSSNSGSTAVGFGFRFFF
ncbi:MAG: hypothetical protein KAT71_03430 [Gammaproteobacteria bacterium]|nr:hypothetical protein [Gammaproteobacteria bacterium]